MKVQTHCKFCGRPIEIELSPDGIAEVEEALADKGGADRLLNGIACNHCADQRNRRYKGASREDIERARNAGGPGGNGRSGSGPKTQGHWKRTSSGSG